MGLDQGLGFRVQSAQTNIQVENSLLLVVNGGASPYSGPHVGCAVWGCRLGFRARGMQRCPFWLFEILYKEGVCMLHEGPVLGSCMCRSLHLLPVLRVFISYYPPVTSTAVRELRILPSRA